MADNVNITAGSGTVIAADDIGSGVLVQRVKTTFGADGTATDVDGTHPLPTRAGAASTATLTNVSASASSVSLLASTAGRLGAILINDGTATLYLKYGATASTTSHTYQILPGQTWEMPAPIYTGAIDGIWSAANGSARITELT